ncbi:gem-associated protein 8-like isoform X2 [Cimex lectularius]|uniref:Uncharacterized protein n=1 Tax=Cimex lectularius TaxID=79782 RepID=A0A8I6SNT1_CIMLE|nr:gem-associated protein 8-like isoform X1 [Cimex lectularius]XP_024085489.1 gem-associated protein 8-like isoform X2 [Cimex lectularius]
MKKRTKCDVKCKKNKSRGNDTHSRVKKYSSNTKRRMKFKRKLGRLQQKLQQKETLIKDLQSSMDRVKNHSGNQVAGAWFWHNYSIVMSNLRARTSAYQEYANEILSDHEERCEEEQDSDDDLVVSEEFMEFLEKNRQYRLARDKEKERKQLEEAKKGCSEDEGDDCKVPDVHLSELKRKKEIELLYGKHSAKIQGMETALQLTFNRHCDQSRPPYWPNLSFTFAFKHPLKLE